MKNNIIVGILAVVVSIGIAYVIIPGVRTEVTREVVTQQKNVGAASNVISDPCFSVGDIWECAAGRQLQGDAASTTSTVLQPPQFGSSTLQSLTCRVNSGTTTAMQIRFWKSASPWVTTTQLMGGALAANTITVVKATSTVLDSSSSTFGPLDYLVITTHVAGGGAGTSSPIGACSADFLAL